MKANHIRFPLKTPYYTLNKLTDQTERVWLAFHGYGQLAQFFIKKFEGLDAKKNFIIAPQGISKYYLKGVNGRVGASWMTKEDRLTEIENQFAYIDAVLNDVGDISKKQLIYFGFSQGTATMGRYAAHSQRPFTKMIIWAGTFPPDTKKQNWRFLKGTEQILYYTSKEDIYFREEMITQQREVLLASVGVDPLHHWYDGGHRVIADIVTAL
ncbi:MAG: alpha/beta hydrolase [Bacteroidota bacterium]